MSDSFASIKPETLSVGEKSYLFYPLSALRDWGYNIDQLPFSIRVLLEAALRQRDGQAITDAHIHALATWPESVKEQAEIPFKPARIVLQDFTGVPAVADLAAMRSWLAGQKMDPEKVNPLVPVDLVIDHSVMVDEAGHDQAFEANIRHEFKRNGERYRFLRWAQTAFHQFRVVPPGTGIVHQVNLEYLAGLVAFSETDQGVYLFPDSLVGTDSHTTMIDGLGIVGWGVGGIEAEACMLGQPLYLTIPEVIGVRVSGALPTGSTATDIALVVTQMLRKEGVVGKFVEFFGPGVANMTLPDRATIANMSPEYGATMGLFPVDSESLDYLLQTGRDCQLVETVEAYYRAQGLFTDPNSPDPVYTKTLDLDLSAVKPSLAGPKRPQQRVDLNQVQKVFRGSLQAPVAEDGYGVSDENLNLSAKITINDQTSTLRHGSVVIAAITSCTNTSNPSVMLGAGIMAKKAVQLGMRCPSYVKTSLTPGSQVVTEYLVKADLLKDLESLGFHMVGYGCCTCIGNSGPLPEPVAEAVDELDLTVYGVLSGNRNFEGRIHPQLKGNFLASPILVVAYALAGTVDLNLATDAIGQDKNGQPVYLKDIWPTEDEIRTITAKTVSPELFRKKYADVFAGTENWNKLDIPSGALYAWDQTSTYIQEPPFFETLNKHNRTFVPFSEARVLALLGDTVTTDHISPAGSIAPDSPAGQYLQEQGVKTADFNAYGARRGNHEVMLRGTFANTRIRNRLVPDVEGGYTRYFPSNEMMPIYDAAMKYKHDKTELIVMAGKEYGTGSSRDWAAKGVLLLGVKAVIAESYERIHRSNLVGMGVLPLQFKPGESYAAHGLNGEEIYTLQVANESLQPLQNATLVASRPDGTQTQIDLIIRLDSQMEIAYYLNGGILQTVLLDMKKNQQR